MSSSITRTTIPQRQVTRRGALAAAATTVATLVMRQARLQGCRRTPEAASIIPVVGDGKWIWTEPPKNGSGYLEPRSFEFEATIELEGTGPAGQIRATTPFPVSHPEQELGETDVAAEGCHGLRRVGSTAGQLVVAAGSIARGQVLRAKATGTLTLYKDYRGFQRDRFPETQVIPRTLRGQALGDSPGIQVHNRVVRELAADLGSAISHPWDRARVFYEWVWEHITPHIGVYTNVVTAINKGVGDCEERAAVFVALCRASGIPARLVWVPNHNWAEIYLSEDEQRGHWIPVHTAAYSWFGWTGTHELVLQKGDKLQVPEQGRPQRLLADWLQWKGSRPQARFLARLTPQAPSAGVDAGPGAREKIADGRWRLLGEHDANRYLRDA